MHSRYMLKGYMVEAYELYLDMDRVEGRIDYLSNKLMRKDK